MNTNKNNYETVKLSVPTLVNVPFLPTKRSRNERHTEIEMNVPAEIKIVEEKDFPLAFRVTDYKDFAEGLTKKEYDSLSHDEEKKAGDFGLRTEEIRLFGGRLYSPVHVNLYGRLNSTLYETNPDFIQEELRFRNYYNDVGTYSNEFDKDKSVINEEKKAAAFKEKAYRIQRMSENYVMSGGKVWKECGEPYLSVQTFGWEPQLYGFIEYLHDTEKFTAQFWQFSAFHQQEWNDYIQKSWAGTGKKITGDGKKIEVLMPECVKIKDFIDVEKEKEAERNSRLEVIAEKYSDASVSEPAASVFEKEMKGYLKASGEKNLYNAARLILSNWKDEKKKELNQFFHDNNIKEKKDFDKYLAKTFLKEPARNQDKKPSRKAGYERER